jgi:LmbE family N-acetylglucosaminyl deacetylase
MRKYSLIILLLLSISPLLRAQLAPVSPGSAELYQQMKKLNVVGSVLYIAAHPDDENNGLLPYLAKERLYRTAYLSLTRGDGGQNLIGPEQGIELGMIRTHELVAARIVDGSEQYFTRAYEFGYSKRSDEALRIWNRDQVLADIVWVIRNLQPDIIITRFPGDERAGHGHHSASSILANEAYLAAADPKQFPEQLEKYGLKPWKAKRILWNTFNFGRTNTIAADQLKIEVGNYNALLGKSYGEIGGEARSMHKSQGEGRPRRKGEVLEYFTTTGGEPAKSDIMEGVDVNWSRFKSNTNSSTGIQAELDAIQSDINTLLKEYDFREPSLSIPQLVRLYKKVNSSSVTAIWKEQKLKEIQELIEQASGLFVEAFTQQETALKGDSVRVSLFINNRSGIPMSVKQIGLDDSRDSLLNLKPGKNMNYTYPFWMVPTKGSEETQPYWLAKNMSDGMFVVDDQRKIGKAWNDALFTAKFQVEIEGQNFLIQRPVLYKYVDAVRGEVYQPFIIVPHLDVYLDPAVHLMKVIDEQGRNRADSFVNLIIRPNFDGKNIPTYIGIRQQKARPFLNGTPMQYVKGKKEVVRMPFKVIYDPTSSIPYMEATVSIRLPNGKQLNHSNFFKAIRYDHIPTIHYAFADNIRVVSEEIKVRGKKVGFIAGSGDMMPEALKQLGYDVQELTDADVTDEQLKQYDAIVTGVRAYNLHEWLTAKYDVMMRYIENGGNLIVQYNRNNQGTISPKIAPYPFQISGTRVSEEDAQVRFNQPAHPVLNVPNKITDADFSNWIQERSTYQADQADPRYDMPLSMNDMNEPASNGSLLIGKYGKGNFAYVSLAMFRQLPAGNAGAFKLLANLIALPDNK